MIQKKLKLSAKKMSLTTKENIKAVAILILMLFIAGVIGYLFNTCKHTDLAIQSTTYKQKFDSLSAAYSLKNDTVNDLKKQIVKLDSISKIIKPSYRKTKKYSRDFIQNNPCDSVGILQAFDLTVQKCDTVILIDSLKIMKLEEANEQYFSMVKDHYLMLREKEKQLQALEIDLGIEKKKVKTEKRKKIAAIGAGILAVIATIFIMK